MSKHDWLERESNISFYQTPHDDSRSPEQVANDVMEQNKEAMAELWTSNSFMTI